MKNSLRPIILTGLFALPFIPLIVAGSHFFPYITGKNFTFRIVIEIIFALWLILCLTDKSVRPKFSWIWVLFGVFIAVIGVADALGEYPYKSFWSNYERMEGFVSLVHLFAYFTVLGNMLKTKKMWNRFLHTSLLASIITVFYGFGQLGGEFVINQGGVRLDATLGNATYLAIYMLFHMFVAGYLMYQNWNVKWTRFAYSIAILAQGFILYKTATRGSILGLIGGVGVTAILLAISRQTNKKIRLFSVGAIVATAVLVFGFLAVKNTDFVRQSPVLSRFAYISFEESTTKARFLVWNMAWQGFLERPVLGWGQENFNYVFNKYYHPQMYAQEQWFDRTHNVFLDWLIAGGILGLLAYLSLFVAVLYYLWVPANFLERLRHRFARLAHLEDRTFYFDVYERAILTGLLTAYFFHNLFVFDNLVSYMMLFGLFAFIHAGSARKFVHVDSPEIKENQTYYALTGVIGVACIATLYIVNIPALNASATLINALSPESGTAEESLENFEKALSYESFGTTEIREQISQAALRVRSSSQVSEDTRNNLLALARNELIKQTERTPNDARYFIFIGSYLNTLGSLDEARGYLQRAVELSPRKQTMIFELGSNYLNAGMHDEALAQFKKAFELAPEYELARIIYAVSALYADEFALAEEVLTEHFGTDLVYDQRLIRAYSQKGMYDKVFAIWENEIAKNPNNPQLYMYRAGSYLETDQNQNAIADLRKAVELNPNFKNEGEFIIEEIEAGRNPLRR
ncbi:MAG: O-antigen ligase family protein [Candidatus Paceibacterota bacterium]